MRPITSKTKLNTHNPMGKATNMGCKGCDLKLARERIRLLLFLYGIPAGGSELSAQRELAETHLVRVTGIIAAMPASLRNTQSKSCFRARVLFVLLSTAAWSQTPQDTLHSLVGQKLILRRLGDEKEANVKKNDLARLNGTCDLAVEVKEATWSSGAARFRLEEIGMPSVPVKSHGCKMAYDEVKLEISGFAQDEKSESLAVSISDL